jgi:hypothetical protein
MGVNVINNNQGGSIRVLRTTPSINEGGVWVGNYFLDAFPGATAGYSLRKLSINYNGPCIRVRRSSDNAEQDIGFDGDGIGSRLDERALLAFVGNVNGFVTRWYDQSGNGLHQIRTTAIEQPQIVTNGALYKNNNKTAVYFDGTMSMRPATMAQLTSPSGEWSSVGVVSTIAFDRNRSFISSDGNPDGTRIGLFMRTLVSAGRFSAVAFNTSALNFNEVGITLNANQNILVSNRTTTSIEIFANNGETNGPTATSGTPIAASGFLDIGYRNGINFDLAQPFGYIQELIHYPSATTSTYLNIMRSINQYYKTF